LKPVLIPHASYQDFVLQQLQLHYSGGILVVHKDDWPLIAKLWITDLSHLTTLLLPHYDDKGPEPRDPASMFRSYLLFLLVRPEIGITAWIREMHRVPLYAILSGFHPGDIPGVGTFYDFLPRLWAAERKHYRAKVKSAKSRKRRTSRGKKGKKGEKSPVKLGRVKRLVEWILPRLGQNKPLPSDRLFELFQSQFLAVSANLGLLGDMAKLNVAGDGTPIVTAAYPRSKPTCKCSAQGLAKCNHPRIYSQPDCDSGWDSSREKYFNGYHAYVFSACDSPYDLPLYPRLFPASSHDAVNFVLSSVEFSQRLTLGTLDKILLDAAHDAEAIYQLINVHNQNPIIDLNKRGKKNSPVGDGIEISPEGVPICPNGKKMKPNGYDKPRTARSGDVRHPADVPLPSTGERTTRTARTIPACSQRSPGQRKSGKPSTNGALPLNARTNERR
jgi:hypothetical protein